jgi:hypothetical protein
MFPRRAQRFDIRKNLKMKENHSREPESSSTDFLALTNESCSFATRITQGYHQQSIPFGVGKGRKE